MCSEDVFDLLEEFPMHLKTEPLDDLFGTEPKPVLDKKLFETPAPLFNYDGELAKSSPRTPSRICTYEGEQTKDTPGTPASVVSYEGKQVTVGLKSPAPYSPYDGEQMKTSPEAKVLRAKMRLESSSPRPTRSDSSSKSSVVTTEDDSALVGGPPMNTKASKLHPYEDFHSFLIREGGIERERLARLVSSQEHPRPEEDFVSFLARSVGIKDEQYVTSLRQALRCEPVIEFTQPQVPVKMEVDQTRLEIGPDEDAVSFFVRAGSWESTSSVDDELAFVGLEEDEDAESFLRRTGNLSNASLELESLKETQLVPPGIGSFITAKQELEALKEQVLVQVSSPNVPVKEGVLEQVSSPSTPEDMEGVVFNRKRRSPDSE